MVLRSETVREWSGPPNKRPDGPVPDRPSRTSPTYYYLEHKRPCTASHACPEQNDKIYGAYTLLIDLLLQLISTPDILILVTLHAHMVYKYVNLKSRKSHRDHQEHRARHRHRRRRNPQSGDDGAILYRQRDAADARGPAMALHRGYFKSM